MPKNLLLHEFDEILSKVAALHCARDGARLTKHGATWVAALGHVSVDIGLTIEHRHDGVVVLVPHLRMGTSSTLHNDVLVALAMLRDAEATIQRALLAWAAVHDRIVWHDAAPCDECGASGRSFGNTSCRPCAGTGKRRAPTLTPETTP